MQAVKLIYLTMFPGVRVRHAQDGQPDGLEAELLRQLSIDEADALLKKHRAELPGPLASKLEQGVRAARGGVERVHIIDGRVEEGLLAEVFSNEGVGTLIHANEYQAIRRAVRRDARAILALTQTGVANDELVRRTRAEIERQIDDFFVFEVDRNPVGCAALHLYPQWGKAELAAVCVDAALREPRHRRQADAVRRSPGPRAGGVGTVLPVHAGVQLFSAEGRLRPRHTGRPAAAAPRTLRQERPAVVGAGQEAGVSMRWNAARWGGRMGGVAPYLWEPEPMSQRLLAVSAGVLLLAAAPLCADDAEDQAVKAVEKLGGQVVRDDDDPAKPVIKVSLRKTGVTDVGLKELAGLKGLQTVLLDDTGVTDAGLKELAGLKGLQTLGLNVTQITDAGLKQLAGLKGLQALHLGGTGVTDAGLKELAGLKGLRTLSLGDTKVTDAGLKELGGLQGLSELYLYKTTVTDAGLRELAGLKRLRLLDIRGTQVTDAGLNELVGLQALLSLELGDTRVTDAGLKNLAGVKGLRLLYLFNTKVTDAGVAELEKELPGCKIMH